MPGYKKKNEAYTKFLMSKLRGLHKRTMIRVVAMAYHTALSVTHQDSGRAAYNWNLKIGAGASFEKGDWYQRPRTARSKNSGGKTADRYKVVAGHPVGYQGMARGAGHQRIVKYNMKQVKLANFNPHQGARSIVHTELYKQLGGGKAGGVTKVVLYNPLYNKSKYPAYADSAFDDYRVTQQIDAAIRKAVKAEMSSGRQR